MVLLVLAAGACLAEKPQLLTIGTGGVTGVYYPAGGAIARLINKGQRKHRLRAVVETTRGSVYNLNAVASGQMTLAIVQSDWLYHAYGGSSVFADKGSEKDLRVVFFMHAEPFTVLARKETGIRELQDLPGWRVNIGNPGSGQRETMQLVMKKMGWTWDSFRQIGELRADEQARALCNNEIDAMVYMVGHPNGSIREAATNCDVTLVNIRGPVIDALIDANRYYRKVNIPGGLYRGNSRDVETFGVSATLVSSADVPDETIYQVVTAVFDNFAEFRALHPAFAHLQKREMIDSGLAVPLHDGAARYYREHGLLPE